ncbi:MAG: M23 family metallopeptidase [Candidatus Azobacteroides sp.]|nr:M23 family metallopeptidase [Candidatus Azobacteroides sp.]
MARKKRKSFWKNIKVRYQLSVTDETHLNEVFSLRLSKIKFFLFSCFLFLLIFSLVGILILATPIKNFLPGYLDEKYRDEVVNYSLVVDSLSKSVEIQEAYLENLKRILSGEISPDTIMSIDSLQYNMSFSGLYPSEEEEQFRKEFEQEEKYNLSLIDIQSNALPAFFAPTKGIITSSFDSNKKHFGIDIATAPDEVVVAVLDGVVIFSGFDINVGNVIVLQHSNDFLSVYKHNSFLLKQTGEAVKAGDIIAVSGNTGTHSTGYHLHFELWHKRKPVNPEEYILF